MDTCKYGKQVNYLCRADANWLLKDNPGYTLQQWGCCQRALIGPIIQGTRKKSLWVKVSKRGLLSLKTLDEERTNINYIEYAPRQKKNCSDNCGKVVFTFVLMESRASRTFCSLGLAEPIWSVAQKHPHSLIYTAVQAAYLLH